MQHILSVVDWAPDAPLPSEPAQCPPATYNVLPPEGNRSLGKEKSDPLVIKSPYHTPSPLLRAVGHLFCAPSSVSASPSWMLRLSELWFVTILTLLCVSVPTLRSRLVPIAEAFSTASNSGSCLQFLARTPFLPRVPILKSAPRFMPVSARDAPPISVTSRISPHKQISLGCDRRVTLMKRSRRLCPGIASRLRRVRVVRRAASHSRSGNSIRWYSLATPFLHCSARRISRSWLGLPVVPPFAVSQCYCASCRLQRRRLRGRLQMSIKLGAECMADAMCLKGGKKRCG